MERTLSRLFALDEVLVNESFTITSPTGNGIVEQIDGVIEVGGSQYLVEMKWHDSPLGVGEVSQHFTRVFGRAPRHLHRPRQLHKHCGRNRARESASAPFVLCTLDEIVLILEAGVTVHEWLLPKIRAAIPECDPLRLFSR